MSKRGRNDPCPSGAGEKFKKCLGRHPELGLQSTAGDIWWVCGSWQGDEPELGEMMDGWLQAADPAPDKVEHLFERIFAEPVESVDWARLLRQSREKRQPGLPGLYRRINALLSTAEIPDPGRVHDTAADIFREDHPEMYEEVLAAILTLDPATTRMESLENIVVWAVERNRTEDCDRLRERFPEFPEYLLEALDDPEADARVDPIDPETSNKTEPKYPPEVERRLDAAWEEFNAIKNPTPADAEALLDALLELPHEATNWCDPFDILRRVKHPGLFRIFEGLISDIGSAGAGDLSFVAWGAMEEAVRRHEIERLPEISRSLRRLDAANFDPDAVSHLEDYLMAHGFVDECLAMKEHIYPALCASDQLMDWVLPRAATEILTLRLGGLVADDGLEGRDTDGILTGLLDGIEDRISLDFITPLIQRLLAGASEPRSAEEFELPLEDEPVERQDRRWTALEGALVDVARHEWQVRQVHPGRTLVGLRMMHWAAGRWIDSRREKKRKFRRNLLDYLDPHNIERQVAMECQDIMGTNTSRARIMLDAHKALAFWAEAHGIPLPADGGSIERQVDELIKKVRP